MSSYDQEFCAKCGNGFPLGQLCKLCLPQPSVIEPGTRVRVTFEAVVIDRTNPRHQGTPCVRTNGGSELGLEPTDTVEIIAPPEREFEDQALYLDEACDMVFRYSKKADSFITTGIAFSATARGQFEGQCRLTKLIPEDSA